MHNGGMADTVQQIKDKLSIVDVVSQYVKLERSGSSLRARCPFHAERTPSFHVSPERGTYHCFGCNVGGDIFSFVETIEGLDFKGALKVLADKAGVPLVYEKQEKKDERDRLFELMEIAALYYQKQFTDTAKKYLSERGLVDATMQEFRVGWAGDAWSEASDYFRSKKFSEREILEAGLARKGERGLIDKFRNRIMFPIGDSAGRVVGFSGRIFGDKASPEAPKYLNSPETPLYHKSRILYGFDKAKLSLRKLNCAVLVEGQMDLLMSHQAGWSNTIAVSGTAFTIEHASLIHRMTDNLVLALDADQAGIKAAGKAARIALQGGLNVKVARLPSGLDPADYILKEGADAWKAAIRDSKDIVTFLLDVLEEHSPQADRFRRVVEAVVLPFLTDVQSPIAREQYVREIAKRLGVSHEAVAEALKKQPRTPDAVPAPAARHAAAGSSDDADTKRARNAVSLLLWQKAQKKPDIDVEKYQRELEDAIGPHLFSLLMQAEHEHESMRFAAEALHGKSGKISHEAHALLTMLLKDRLSKELRQASAALKSAEASGDEAEQGRLVEVCKLLTARIAQLSETV